MRFSIIIPTYNERDYIGRCLGALLRQEYDRAQFEIIVSDASSSDGTLELARKHADKIAVGTRKGIAHGRNQGANAAAGEILLFVDADVELAPDFLRRLARAFAWENTVAVTGRAVPIDGGVFRRFVYHGVYVLVRLFLMLGLPLFPGMCVAYRAEAFRTVGGFREDFGVCEDLDLSRRIAQLGSCSIDWGARAFVSTRRLEKHGLSTILFHIYHDILYLLTGKAPRLYPKVEEIRSARDLWKMNRE
jgi:glycosyltransferase involved in cell wall biosynthesis